MCCTFLSPGARATRGLARGIAVIVTSTCLTHGSWETTRTQSVRNRSVAGQAGGAAWLQRGEAKRCSRGALSARPVRCSRPAFETSVRNGYGLQCLTMKTRAFKIAAVAFWLFMTGWFVRYDAFPGFFTDT